VIEILTCTSITLALLSMVLGFALRVQFQNVETVRGWFEDEREKRVIAENRRDEALIEAERLRDKINAARQAMQ